MAEMREFLGRTLPEYMIPAYFVPIDEIPLTTNLKIDRAALPEPGGQMVSGAQYVAPEDEVQEKLLAIWQEVLGIERISIHDNFFEIGGNSILLLTLHEKINTAYPSAVQVVDLFNHVSIARCAQFIDKGTEGRAVSLPVVNLPADFFQEEPGGDEGAPLSFTISGGLLESLKQVAKEEGHSLTLILFSLYVYLFYELGEDEVFAIQGMLGDGSAGEVCSLSVDFEEVESMPGLFQLVAAGLADGSRNPRYRFEGFDLTVNKKANSLLPLFYTPKSIKQAATSPPITIYAWR